MAKTRRRKKPRRWILADNLRALIQARGYGTIADAAGCLGMLPEQLTRYANGSKVPMAATLARILAGLEATEADLLTARPRPGEAFGQARRRRWPEVHAALIAVVEAEGPGHRYEDLAGKLGLSYPSLLYYLGLLRDRGDVAVTRGDRATPGRITILRRPDGSRYVAPGR